MAKTMTQQHDWVAITIQPVDVLPGLDGEPVVFSGPEEAPVQYGCNTCGDALVEGFGSECRGSDGD